MNLRARDASPGPHRQRRKESAFDFLVENYDRRALEFLQVLISASNHDVMAEKSNKMAVLVAGDAISLILDRVLTGYLRGQLDGLERLKCPF